MGSRRPRGREIAWRDQDALSYMFTIFAALCTLLLAGMRIVFAALVMVAKIAVIRGGST